MDCFLFPAPSIPELETAFTAPPSFLRMGLSCRMGDRLSLLDSLKFRSQCQDFRFTGNSTGMFRIEGDAAQIMTYS